MDAERLAEGPGRGRVAEQLSLLTDFPGEPTTAGPLDMRLVGNEWEWTCPHCGRRLDSRAPADVIAADPACSLCRAESHGITIARFLRLPADEKAIMRPDPGWRSRYYREADRA